MRKPLLGDGAGPDRGLSIAITHVLTIAITTTLIAMLLVSSGGMLDTETDRSADQSLETIGERLAGEIANVDQIATAGGEDVRLTAEHPRTVAGSGYEVTLLEAGDCDGPLVSDETDCLRLTASGADVEVYVPLKVDADVEESSVSGGTIEIEYDQEDEKIALEGGNR